MKCMSSAKPDDYLEPYRKAAERHGAGFDATLWRSRKWQAVRFDIMLGMVDFKGRTIVDAGCGTGDFAAHLIDRGVAFARYTGIDGVAAQIEEARSHELAHCEFVAGDFVDQPALIADANPDFVCFSGSLNTMGESIVREVLTRALRATRRGIVFNFLSDRAPEEVLAQQTHPAFRLNTSAMIDWALSQSTRVQFRQDYIDGHDATICIEHADGR